MTAIPHPFYWPADFGNTLRNVCASGHGECQRRIPPILPHLMPELYCVSPASQRIGRDLPQPLSGFPDSPASTWLRSQCREAGRGVRGAGMPRRVACRPRRARFMAVIRTRHAPQAISRLQESDSQEFRSLRMNRFLTVDVLNRVFSGVHGVSAGVVRRILLTASDAELPSGVAFGA